MKKTMKKAFAFLLALTLLLSLAACGKKPEEKPADTPADAAPAAAPDDGNHPDFLYTSEFRTVKDSALYGLRALGFTPEGVFCLGHEPTPDGAAANYCGVYSTEAVLVFVDFEGNMRQLTDFVPMESTEFADMPEYICSTNLSSICPLSDGTFVLLEDMHYEYYNGPEGVTRENDYLTYSENSVSGDKCFYRHIDSNGKDLGSCEVKNDGEYIPIYQIAADENGNIYYNGDYKIGMISPDGTLSTVVSSDSYFSSLIQMRDGSIIVNIMEGDSTNGVYRKLDTVNGALGEAIVMPEGNYYNPIPGGGDYDFYFDNGSGFYGFKIGSESTERLFSWIDCDLSAVMGGSDIYVNDNGDIMLLTSQYCTNKPVDSEIIIISKKSWEEVPHKQQLTLGTLTFGAELENAVLKFNRSSDKYRIKVINYSDDSALMDMCNPSSVDFFEQSRTKFLTALVAGDIPDIINLQFMPFKQLAAKGILEDMNPWLEKDGELSKDDIVPGALRAMEIDGKLYRVFSGFYVYTAIGASSIVGDGEKWDYAKFCEVLSGMPEGCKPMGWHMTREEILENSLMLDMDSYVNWETGECNFERPEFTQFLEYLMLFPTDEELMNHEFTEEDNKAFSRGMQLLETARIYSIPAFKVMDFQRNADAQNISYIGFPSISGNNKLIYAESGLAMTKVCENKDGAWSFIRTLLTPEIQSDSWSIPTNNNLLEKQIAQAMEPLYATDENGEYILDENGEKIQEASDFYFTPDCTQIPIYEMTEEQAELLRSLIGEGGVVENDNSAIIKIVKEELAPYFAGQKSAEEAAKMIQSKVNIYVNEQK